MNCSVRICLWLFALVSCIPAPEFPTAEVCEQDHYRGVFVLNEGVWTQNNSTLSFYDENQDFAACEDAFSAANNSSLGDTGNSFLLEEDTLYLVVNESRIIYKLQMPGLQLIGELRLPVGSSPREMAMISPEKAYATSLLDSSLYRFDPRNMELLGSPIPVENHMEGIALWGNKAFVACGNYAFPASNNKLAIIDTQTDQLIRYLELPEENPGSVHAIGDHIWVNCRGNYLPDGPGSQLVQIDPATEQILRSISVGQYLYDTQAIPAALLAITDSAIARLDLQSYALDLRYLEKYQLTENSLDLIYALAYDDLRGELYVTNARYGGTNGECLVFDPFLNRIRRFETGIFPGEVFFYR